MKKLLLVILIFAATIAFTQPGFNRSPYLRLNVTSISDKVYGPWRYDREFRAGESAYINISGQGFHPDANGRFHLQADLKIPQLGLNKLNIINGNIKAMKKVPMNFHVSITSVKRGGKAIAYIRVRDLIAKKYTTIQTWFKVAP